MPLLQTSGNITADGYGGGAVAVPNYIEECFSAFLYTGNGSTQTITNGIDLSTKGGLVWSKSRSNIENNVLLDTIRGPNNILVSNSTAAGSTSGTPYVTATTTGYSIGTSNNQINGSGLTYASWTFREQPKFFDVVTYTGNGTAGRTVAHSLGSVPACMIVKRTDAAGGWYVYHTSLGATKNLQLSSTLAAATRTQIWNDTAPTSTVFSLGTDTDVNASGATYVAYLFAHNAGGFGLTGTDNVISCGSYTTDGSGNATVSLGYEAQWVMVKQSGATGNWIIEDVMRGMPSGNASGQDAALFPNTSDAENVGNNYLGPTATGFTFSSGASQTYIYIAIRRGPMKVPTSGTSVFIPNITSGTTDTQITTNFPLDLNIVRNRTASSGFQSGFAWSDRLRGLASTNTVTLNSLQSTNTNAEDVNFGVNKFVGNTGFKIAADYSGLSQIYYSFKRAPSYMDVVCYSGTGVAKTETHNLQAVPELMIVKSRAGTGRDWAVYTSATAATNFMYLNGTDASGASSSMWNDTTPTSSVFTVGTNIRTNNSGQTYVAYLFATCAGVSKVGSYTGTATTKQIDCGFTAGARFVLIKRTNSTGDWYVWDTARGIVSGNDPYLLLNSTAAEVTSTDYINTYSAGFEISSTAPAAINASGGTFIFLAIA